MRENVDNEIENSDGFEDGIGEMFENQQPEAVKIVKVIFFLPIFAISVLNCFVAEGPGLY